MTPITLAQAQIIVEQALAAARRDEMRPLCVVVVDAGGHDKAVGREDGASFGRVDIARAKAYGAIGFGSNSRTIEKLAAARPHFITGVVAAIGNLVPVAGGVVIVDEDGNQIGAVGISGDNSDNDELAALAGIEAAGLLASRS